MKKQSSQSHSEVVLTPGDGGLSGPKAQPQPLQSLALGESPKRSSASVQTEQPKASTHLGEVQSSSGNQSVLTAQKESTTPKLTLAGTLNWVLIGLQKYGLVDVVLNTGANRYEIHLPVSTWNLENNLLVLTESENK